MNNTNKSKNTEFLEDLIIRIEEKKRIKKEICENDAYILWLQYFTIQNPVFSNSYWLDRNKDIARIDRDRINNLNLFYEVIEEYAKENYIQPSRSDFGNFYSIKYNDIGYEIGVIFAQGTLFFCQKTSVKDDYIDFVDIQNNKKQAKTDLIKSKLQELIDLINNISIDVPIEEIEKTSNETIKKILQKKFK